MSDFDSTASTPLPFHSRATKRRRYEDSEASTPGYSSQDELNYDSKPDRSSNLRRSPRRGSDSSEEQDHAPAYPLSRSLSIDEEDTPRSSHSSPRADYSRPAVHKPLRLNYKRRFLLKGHRKGVAQVRISPDGCWVASCSADGTAKVWDAQTGKHMRTLEGHLAGVSTIAWSPDSSTLATGSDDKLIRLWDRASGKPYPVPLAGHHNYVISLAFSPKGNMLVSGSFDEALFLWDLRARRQMRSLPAHSDPIGAVDFVRDGTLIASCSTDGLIRVWDTTTGQCLRTIVHEDNASVTTVCFSPNGKYLLAFTLDSCIRLWDYVSGVCKKTYQGHTNIKLSLGGAFGISGTEAFIVSGSEDGDVFFWDVNTKEIVQRIKGHEGGVCWVDSCTATGLVVSGGLDGTVSLWFDVPEEEEPLAEPLEMKPGQEKEYEEDTYMDELPDMIKTEDDDAEQVYVDEQLRHDLAGSPGRMAERSPSQNRMSGD
ncbi:WD domain-containing protein [Phlyctema vagabunda]|uniref:Mitochondrial division protein 1 n=1 Tax=Phlyctema vagabunda TaxID=108571 RepID=A0ABR4P706_9HELO